MFVLIWALLIAFQASFLWYLGDNLNFWGDPHAEADAMRSAQAYIADGLTSHHGLGRILYGNQFPGEGTVKDHVDASGQVAEKFSRDFPPALKDRNQWPLTHYPPGAELLNGTMACIFGLHPIWKLRLLPVAVGLIGLAVLFRTVSLLWGVQRGAIIALAIVVLPGVSLWMPTIEFEGYALALVFIQTSLLLRCFWLAERVPVWLPAVLFLLGFVQGWLSWDHFFLVSLLALPWWLLRRAEGQSPPLHWLFWTTASAASGYALAHIGHAWQVAAELGSWQAAFNELFRTAGERAGFTSEEHVSRLGYTTHALYFYLRGCLRPWRNLTFGPFFGPLLLITLISLISGKGALERKAAKIPLSWPGKRSPIPALAAALLICLLWLLAMPSHTAGNWHYLIRHMFVFYLAMAIVVARCIQPIERPVRIVARTPGTP